VLDNCNAITNAGQKALVLLSQCT